jgi:superfamily II DNA or RNA helicase
MVMHVTPESRFFSNLRFCKTWRPYQQRVLTELERHFGDGKLHVVAAPGAGKTTLGLEVFRCLGKRTLVLSPTRSIRDQWILRLKDFIPENESFPPEWVSENLREPGLFTSVTYQALHTWYRDEQTTDEDDESEIIVETDSLKREEIQQLGAWILEQDIRVLILDEAHHLRQEWWSALASVLKAVPDVVTISLTATPPFDVNGTEWRKYIELCGPIDAEISVPELVKAGTLCPHQDLIWLVKPREKAREMVLRQKERVDVLVVRLRGDPDLLAAVRAHDWIRSSDLVVEDVLEKAELAVALLLFLQEAGDPLPEPLLDLLSVRPELLPEMDRRWWQVLLSAFLFDTQWIAQTPDCKLRECLAKELRASGLLSRRELRIDGLKSLQRHLALCPSKLDALQDIHRLERSRRGNFLRQVVLVDFIRDDGFAAGAEPLDSLGAWPAFFQMARYQSFDSQPYYAMITGRLTILHRHRIEAFCSLCGEAGFSTRAISCLPDYVQIVTPGKPKVAEITALLVRGDLQVLVGTRALLGEGWDAPVVNSLILATAVGSFMLTNQMRGRAIRVDPTSPQKFASIWHIATVEPGTDWGLGELEGMRQKFSTFVGLDAKYAEIRNGVDRMHLPYLTDERMNVLYLDPSRNNQDMAERLADSGGWFVRWREAVERGSAERIAPGVSTSAPLKSRSFLFADTLKRLFYQLLSAWVLFFVHHLQMVPRLARFDNIIQFLLGLLGVTFVVLLPKTLKVVWLCVAHLPVDGSVKQIALVVRDALCACDLLHGPPHRFPVRSRKLPAGAHFLHLQQADFQEQSLFADCLEEVLGPIENPRYLVVREGRNMFGVKCRELHAVPAVFGQKKERAECFLDFWKKRIGPSALHYTRTPEGRKDLVRARVRTFASALQAKSQRVDRWV